MQENPRYIPIEFFDAVDMSEKQRDFSDNVTDLYNAMIQFDPNRGLAYLGELHGFALIYDGAILSVGHPEMDEKSAKALRDDVMGENFEGDAFGNPLGTPEQILVRQGAVIEKMWGVPVDFIHWFEHFANSPNVVFDSLDELAKRLYAYRRKTSGSDQMGINENTLDLKETGVSGGDTKRLTLSYDQETMEIRIADSPDVASESRKVSTAPLSDKQVAKHPNPFSKFLNKLTRKSG